MCAVYANKQLFLSLVMYCLIGAILVNIEPIYAALGQEKEVACLAAKFVYITFPSHFFEVLNNVFTVNFATSQQVTQYMVYALATGTVIHAILIYYWVFKCGWGFDGVCWATAIMFFFRGFIGVSFVKFGGRFPNFPDVRFFSMETFTNLGPLLKVDLEAVAMGVWGWWAFDIFTLMASYLGSCEVAA